MCGPPGGLCTTRTDKGSDTGGGPRGRGSPAGPGGTGGAEGNEAKGGANLEGGEDGGETAAAGGGEEGAEGEPLGGVEAEEHVREDRREDQEVRPRGPAEGGGGSKSGGGRFRAWTLCDIDGGVESVLRVQLSTCGVAEC